MATVTGRTWPSDWDTRRTGERCVACAEGRPDRIPNGKRIFVGIVADAYLNADKAVRGYVLLGNSVPHLHVHIVPRYVDDPDPGRPPLFMLEESVSSPVEPDDYSAQLEALRLMLKA